jgi:hypothetical protein
MFKVIGPAASEPPSGVITVFAGIVVTATPVEVVAVTAAAVATDPAGLPGGAATTVAVVAFVTVAGDEESLPQPASIPTAKVTSAANNIFLTFFIVFLLFD